jgi:hypothetical protein
VKDEKVVWECILRWINHDPDNRKGHIAGLLKGVRLGLLGTKFLRKKVSMGSETRIFNSIFARVRNQLMQILSLFLGHV